MKEITIYDNYYSYDIEKDARQFLFDTRADIENWNSPEDIPPSTSKMKYMNKTANSGNMSQMNWKHYLIRTYICLWERADVGTVQRKAVSLSVR